MKLIHKGKVKDIYEYNNENILLFVFSNRISAFDIPMYQEIPRKGELLCNSRNSGSIISISIII